MKRIFNKETRDYDVVPSEGYGPNKMLVSDADGNPKWVETDVVSRLLRTTKIISFQYMKMGDDVDLICGYTAKEIEDLRVSHDLRYILVVFDMLDPMHRYSYELKNNVIESVQGQNAEYYKLVYHLHFDDNVAPILIDVLNNTITLDPDWVAPTTE